MRGDGVDNGRWMRSTWWCMLQRCLTEGIRLKCLFSPSRLVTCCAKDDFLLNFLIEVIDWAKMRHNQKVKVKIMEIENIRIKMTQEIKYKDHQYNLSFNFCINFLFLFIYFFF